MMDACQRAGCMKQYYEGSFANGHLGVIRADLKTSTFPVGSFAVGYRK